MIKSIIKQVVKKTKQQKQASKGKNLKTYNSIKNYGIHIQHFSG